MAATLQSKQKWWDGPRALGLMQRGAVGRVDAGIPWGLLALPQRSVGALAQRGKPKLGMCLVQVPATLRVPSSSLRMPLGGSG